MRHGPRRAGPPVGDAPFEVFAERTDVDGPVTPDRLQLRPLILHAGAVPLAFFHRRDQSGELAACGNRIRQMLDTPPEVVLPCAQRRQTRIDVDGGRRHQPGHGRLQRVRDDRGVEEFILHGLHHRPVAIPHQNLPVVPADRVPLPVERRAGVEPRALTAMTAARDVDAASADGALHEAGQQVLRLDAVGRLAPDAAVGVAQIGRA